MVGTALARTSTHEDSPAPRQDSEETRKALRELYVRS